MASSILNSDDGVISGTSGLKSTGGDDGVLNIQNNGTTAVTVNAAGNVGIGTTSVTYDLEVKKTVAAGSVIINANNPSNTGAARLYLGNDSTANAAYFQVFGSSHAVKPSIINIGGNASYPLVFDTGGTERARITSDGSLLVNVTGVSGAICYVSSTAASTSVFNSWNKATSGTRFHFEFRDGASGVSQGNITTNGSATTYATSSDYRLKENIAPMTGALSTVAALKPVTYTWKSTGEAGQGFIAHELQEVCPDAVTGEKDVEREVDVFDEEGNKTGTKMEPVYQGVDTSFLVATLTAAIQELKAINDAQAQRIETLEAKVAALEEQ